MREGRSIFPNPLLSCDPRSVIDAVYEKGMFKPAADDLPAWALAKLAEQSPSFAFLADPREDVYSLQDGEPVS